MGIIDSFEKLDKAKQDLDARKKVYDELEKQTGDAYVAYQESFKSADAIRKSLTDDLGSLLPTTVPERVRVN